MVEDSKLADNTMGKTVFSIKYLKRYKRISEYTVRERSGKLKFETYNNNNSIKTLNLLQL